MLHAAICVSAAVVVRAVDNVQGKSPVIRFIAGSANAPDKHRYYCVENGMTLHADLDAHVADDEVELHCPQRCR